MIWKYCRFEKQSETGIGWPTPSAIAMMAKTKPRRRVWVRRANPREFVNVATDHNFVAYYYCYQCDYLLSKRPIIDEDYSRIGEEIYHHDEYYLTVRPYEDSVNQFTFCSEECRSLFMERFTKKTDNKHLDIIIDDMPEVVEKGAESTKCEGYEYYDECGNKHTMPSLICC